MHTSFLGVTYQDNISKRIIEELTMALWDWETDILYNFRFLFRERNVIQINRCVRHHEEIKVISKDEAETKNLLGLGEG